MVENRQQDEKLPTPAIPWQTVTFKVGTLKVPTKPLSGRELFGKSKNVSLYGLPLTLKRSFKRYKLNLNKAVSRCGRELSSTKENSPHPLA